MKHNRRFQLLGQLIFSLAILGFIPSQAGVYSVDDGTGESSLGVAATRTGTDIVWLNQFTSAAGMETIVELRIAYGQFGNADGPPDGHPVTVGIWSDPNNDANPADGQLLTSVAGVIASSHTNTFISYALPVATTIPAGDNFFAGFESSTLGTVGENFAVSRDATSNAGVSWIFASTTGLDLNNLPANAFASGEFGSLGFPGNALIRAVGVPEPSVAMLLGIGLSLTVLCRRRR